MKDPYLLPFILPNVFEISKGLSKDEFSKVLNKLRPLFTLKDPPQNMLSELTPQMKAIEKANKFTNSITGAPWPL